MAVTYPSQTLAVTVARLPEDVYAHVHDPRNLPRWASGLARSIECVGDEWVAQTAQGPMRVRFLPRNDLGVLDHSVSPQPGVEISVPLRVVAKGDGSEVMLTLFRLPGMSGAQFEPDAALVLADLRRLKALLEG